MDALYQADTQAKVDGDAQDQVGAQDQVQCDGQDLLDDKHQADTPALVDGEDQDQGGAQDQVLRKQDLVDVPIQADTTAQDLLNVQDQADGGVQVQPVSSEQSTGGDQAGVQDQISPELHTGAVQDQALGLSKRRKRGRFQPQTSKFLTYRQNQNQYDDQPIEDQNS